MPMTCTVNHYCPIYSKSPSQCPNNTASPLGASQITNCSANAGFYGHPGTLPQICTPNYYCQKHSTSPSSCPQNTNSPLGSIQITNCSANAGFYGQPGTVPQICGHWTHFCRRFCTLCLYRPSLCRVLRKNNFLSYEPLCAATRQFCSGKFPCMVNLLVYN